MSLELTSVEAWDLRGAMEALERAKAHVSACDERCSKIVESAVRRMGLEPWADMRVTVVDGAVTLVAPDAPVEAPAS